jgi:hypothetical protein
VVVIFHFTDSLFLSSNSLTGRIPSEIALLTNLGESSVVWLLVVTIGVVCFIVLTCVVMFILQLTWISRKIV